MSIEFSITSIFDNIVNVTYESLLDYFKKNYNNKIFVKKITENLLLIHNNFDTKVSSDILYNECRSMVIKTGENPKVISYTHENIEYLKISEVYDIIVGNFNSFEESYEGTLISVFNDDGKWYFITSRCVSIDSSYYYDNKNTFGFLFDDCLSELGITDRLKFTEILDPNICYYFVIVHHKNKYVVDYTSRFGENYKKLINVFNREKETQKIIETNIVTLDGIIVPLKFEKLQDGINYIINNENTEGLIIKINEELNKTKLIKVHSDEYWLSKSHNPNYPNKWFVYLDIFKKNDEKFTIADYQKEKNINDDIVINNKKIDITGMFCLLHKEVADILFNIIMHFTTFDYISKTFNKINTADYEIFKDKKFSVLRKQLAVLQNLILKNKIRTATDIILHLKKYVTVEEFIGLLKCLRLFLMIKQTSYIKRPSKNYSSFSYAYLQLLS